MRPSRLVASVVLTTSLALVALPGLASSQNPRAERAVEAAALQAVSLPSRAPGQVRRAAPDAALRSAGWLSAGEAFGDPGRPAESDLDRPAAPQPGSPSASEDRPPRVTLTGVATFYDHGTTAMRLPRGTLVVICGAGGCIERRISDYGPNAAMYPERIVDLYRPDFFAICGCPWYAGTTRVTVRVY